jgi:Mrp family chromosome partitioning ATPase
MTFKWPRVAKWRSGCWELRARYEVSRVERIDMSDQADKLRSLVGRGAGAVERSDGGLPMVVVTGARAGVGATTVALNLAAVLADRDDQVLLVETAPLRLEAGEAIISRRDVKYGLGDVLAGTCGIKDAIVTGVGGLQMLLQRSGSRGATDPTRQTYERFLGELRSLKGQFDLIVVDAGRGLAPWSQRLWSQR